MKNLLAVCLLLNFYCINAQEQITVYFDFNKSELNEQSKQKLAFFEKSKDYQVLSVSGYCDWKGTNQYNDSLAVKRALVVYEYLRSIGVPTTNNFEQKGFGENFNQSKIQSENRKVIVSYLKKELNIKPDSDLQTMVSIAKKGDKITLKNLNFYNSSPVLLPESEPILRELLEIMRSKPNLKIEIQGHICCQLVADNMDVSTSRARAVYNFLTQHKIDRKRLSYKGFGISKPLHPIPENSAQEEKENRRVEIMILEN